MRSGKLRNRIAFQSFTSTPDSMGQSIETYSTYMTVWGSINQVRGKEVNESQQRSGEATILIRVRYNSSIDITDRMTNDGRTFEINSIDNVEEMNDELIIMAKEVK